MRRKIAGFKSHGINPNAKHSKSPCECIHLVRRDVYSKIMRADSQFIYRESVSSDTVRGPAHAPSKPRSKRGVYRSVSRVNTSFRPRLPLAPLSTRTYLLTQRWDTTSAKHEEKMRVCKPPPGLQPGCSPGYLLLKKGEGTRSSG